MGNKKQVRTIRERYGKGWWAEQAGKPHKRGATFTDPEVRAKAIETRRRNREQEKLDEIQPEDSV